MKRFIAPLFCVGLLMAPPWSKGQEVLDVERDRTKLVPISIEGFSGEVNSTLRFDLEIQGFGVVTPDKAQFQVSGSNGASLIGRVTDRINKTSLLSKEYTGGTPRSQAHTFSDDIVQLTGRRGIARTKIAFKSESGGNSEIYVADYDGYNAVAVTADNTITRDPVWVPGKRVLFYTSYKLGPVSVYTHDLQGRTRRPFARYPGMNAMAAASPDGRKVAMILSQNGSPDVYVCDIDGGNLRQLTFTRDDESSPTWSPDSQTICFTSRTSGRAALYVVSANGGAMRRLRTDGAINCTEPDWSPDGKTIAFTANMGGFQLCTVPAGGGTATMLKVAGEDPSWAPNSRNLIFTRRAGGRRAVSLLDVPTKTLKDIKQTSGSCSQPSWAK
jgi:TolB protein